MASCDTCRAPGSCCRGFVLNIGRVPEEVWREYSQAIVRDYGLPFVPARVSVMHGVDGSGGVAVMFDCPLLGADGRCTDYANRPRTCINFDPGSDFLCCETPRQFKGVPIMVA